MLREGRDAVLARVRAGDAPRGAPRRRAAGRARRGVGPRRGDAVAQPLRRATGSTPRWPRFEHVFVLEDHAPVGGLGDGLRAALPGRAIDGLRRRGLARLRDARRGAPLPRPGRRVARRADRRAASASPLDEREARLGRPPRPALDPRLRRRGDRRAGSDERLDGRARRGVPRPARGGGGVGRPAAGRPGARTATSSPLPPGVADRVARAASTPGSTAGSATTRSRSA